ncbi:MAG: FKBP-type peptidyl-prolyl cis-trans isomerase N-terminal domain-containing protein [Desulfuromonadales bacterium]|jgi:FKBP-type peptidyl-prolyl cis-trans isomerase FklB
MKAFFVVIIALLLSTPLVLAADKVELKDLNDKINYSIGYQIGGDFVKQNIALKPEAIIAGIRAAVESQDPLLTEPEMTKILMDLKDRIVAEQRRQASEAGQAFLDEYRKQDGVVEMPMGVMYRVLEVGTGPVPGEKDSVVVHYKTRTIDGVEVGNTYTDNQPKTYRVGRMMPGLRDVLLRMMEGAKWEVVVPLGQMNNPNPDLPGQGILVYEIELVSVKPTEEATKKE